MFFIYNTDYMKVNRAENGSGFMTKNAAARFIFKSLPSDDIPYMVGDEEEMEKLIIENRVENMSMVQAIQYAAAVVRQGRISNDNTEY